MKYKDFKSLTTDDMKNIVGGNVPEEGGGKGKSICLCGNNSIGCSFNSFAGALNCTSMAAQVCGNTAMSCSYTYQAS